MPFIQPAQNPAGGKPSIASLDHLVLTVKDLNATLIFYSKVLGMSVASYANGRVAVQFGNQKINLHTEGKEYSPHALHPIPGSADLCFVSSTELDEWISHLEALQIPVIEGPVGRTGASGPMTSIYIQDPDKNLIEIAKYH